MKPSERPHYVNNRDFSNAVVDYVTEANSAIEADKQIPIVPNYIAECFLKICEGLSRKSNFVRYSYREEMVMDAVENCLKAIKNYNVENATRSGKPNAFGYFTQIAWFAFIRRIQKEKKQQDAKLRFIAEAGLDEFMIDADEDPAAAKAVQSFVDNLRRRIDDVKEKDQKFETYKKKMTNKRAVVADSDLSEFLGD
jgi:flagellar hook-basal body complex protein FliE